MSAPNQHRDTLAGFAYAGGAYVLWSILPIYFRWMAHVPAWEMVCHRVLWSLPVVALVIWLSNRGPTMRAAFRSPRTLVMAALLALLLAGHWAVYIYAVYTDRVLQTALGYYVAPLGSMLLAVVLLGERFDATRIVAIALAILAVVVLSWDAGGLPWITIAIGVSWSVYAYFKRTLPVPPIEGFGIEVIVLTPLALAALAWNGLVGIPLANASPADAAMIALSGPVTAVPLMLYALGAKGLRLSTIAILQYMSPSLLFLIAVFVFKEPFSATKLAAFLLIWTALILYTVSFLRQTARS